MGRADEILVTFKIIDYFRVIILMLTLLVNLHYSFSPFLNINPDESGQVVELQKNSSYIEKNGLFNLSSIVR